MIGCAGDPIGEVGPNMRDKRLQWFIKKNVKDDPICKNNCLDVCVQYNNTVMSRNKVINAYLLDNK